LKRLPTIEAMVKKKRENNFYRAIREMNFQNLRPTFTLRFAIAELPFVIFCCKLNSWMCAEFNLLAYFFRKGLFTKDVFLGEGKSF
jgi:hypothetical protein